MRDKQRKQLAWEDKSELARRSYLEYVAHVHRGNFIYLRYIEYIFNRL